MADVYKVLTSLYADTFKRIDSDGEPKTRNNRILMGSYVLMLNESNGPWEKIKAFGIEGWIDGGKLGDSPDYKCFYVDVGQGDAALIEIGNDTNGLKILVDGGPSNNLARYLGKYQYKYYFDKNQPVHIDYVFVSHFDTDHYQGLIEIINDDHYTFGTIYHAGIAKFNNERDDFPNDYNTELGKKIKINNVNHLITHFNTISELEALKNKGGMLLTLEKFFSAVNNAKNQNRLQDFKRLDHQSTIPSKQINGKTFSIAVLGPVTRQHNGKPAYKYFKDESHTINGHSLVLKMQFGQRTFLFGGDLNTDSENHLLEHYNAPGTFEVDVAKSCHHGASEFTEKFMEDINPFATVISSGDNETYSHPRADAIGCAGKYSRATRPLVFSTELARSSNVETDKILFGMINLRSNGNAVLMAQMKEASKSGDVWDMYLVN